VYAVMPLDCFVADIWRTGAGLVGASESVCYRPAHDCRLVEDLVTLSDFW
jgi:hypothetical protein